METIQTETAARPATKDGYKMQGIFRFALSIMVLWSHSLAKFFPEMSSVMAFLQLGNAAVSVFFVLSGFLMAQAVSRWYWERPLNFIMNRYVRIAPPLLVAAVVAIVAHIWAAKVGTLSLSLEEVPASGLTTENAIREVLAPLFPFNGLVGRILGLTSDNYYQFVRYSWAIFTEILFYWVLFGFAICARALKTVTLAATFFLLLCAGLSVLGILSTYPLLTAWIGLRIKNLPFAFHFQWTPHFLLGVLSYYCAQSKWLNAKLNVTLFAVILAAFFQIWLYGSHGGQSAIGLLITYGSTLILTILIMASETQEYRLKFFTIGRKHDRAIGDLSYPIYINQFSLALVVLSVISLTGINLIQSSLLFRLMLWIFFNVALVCVAFVLIAITDTITVSVRNKLRGATI